MLVFLRKPKAEGKKKQKKEKGKRRHGFDQIRIRPALAIGSVETAQLERVSYKLTIGVVVAISTQTNRAAYFTDGQHTGKLLNYKYHCYLVCFSLT